jgi:hypothetical protein
MKGVWLEAQVAVVVAVADARPERFGGAERLKDG